jgi:uncharacterized membrane protein YeaQ/YmgE (transglycosylase-associated protein family)
MDGLIWILLVGGVVGWLAGIIMKTGGQMGILANIVVGIVGAVLGGVLFGILRLAPYGFAARLFMAVVGASVLIAILKALKVFK